MITMPMVLAPKNKRILLLYWPYHYRGVDRQRWEYSEWQRTPEPVWTEVHWVDKKEQTGSEPHWEAWTGDPKCSSSEHIKEKDCIAWMPVPGR